MSVMMFSCLPTPLYSLLGHLYHFANLGSESMILPVKLLLRSLINF